MQPQLENMTKNIYYSKSIKQRGGSKATRAYGVGVAGVDKTISHVRFIFTVLHKLSPFFSSGGDNERTQ